jgi:beta-lactamase class A
LIGWLIACKTGDAKLRAGLPKARRIGDKTSSAATMSQNAILASIGLAILGVLESP